MSRGTALGRKDSIITLALAKESTLEPTLAPKISYYKKRPKAQEYRSLSRTQLKKIRVPPSKPIAQWLEGKNGGYIVAGNHQNDRNKVLIPDLLSAQNFLLAHLQTEPFEESTYHDSLSTLERLGYTINDLQEWSRILRSHPYQATAYLQSKYELPLFLLLIILRYNHLSQSDVRSLLVHTWHHLLGHPKNEIASMMAEHREDALLSEEWCVQPWKLSSATAPKFRKIELNAFMVLISRFLKQARRTLPQAIPSITYLFGSYLWFTNGTLEPRFEGSANLVDGKIHRRLSRLYNQGIKILSLPANGAPARYMSFGWEGQKFLLEQAARYLPPLLLDQDSYRGIIRVLSGSKKSATEMKFARNLVASWPPWRDEQDGIDAERPLEDDLTRPVLATRRMVEAGYHLDFSDRAMQIMGGREADCSPTIASRHISTRRTHKVYGEQRVWLARVKSTRNVREAWMAFKEFEKEKGAMSAAFYHAVFEKLVFERLRHIRVQRSRGEAKEVMQYASLQFSEDELVRTEPMEEHMLYKHMIETGIRPSGRFLDFLIRNAPSVVTGIRYLQDADVNSRALAVMLDCTICKEGDARVLDMIPSSTLDAFVKLLCRFTCGHLSINKDNLPSKSTGVFVPPTLIGVRRCKTPLHYAIRLVRFYKPIFRPAWYSIFRALAGPRVIIAAPFIGHPKDDVLSWHVLKEVLAEFHSRHLELELTGFHSICTCFEKAMRSSWIPEERSSSSHSNMPACPSENWGQGDLEAVKEQWRRMTESTGMPFATPRLLHSFHPVVIHAYIRVLGFARDWKEMVSVLEWMIKHRDELDEEAEEYGSGICMRRRVFVAMRCFLEGAKRKETASDEQQDRNAGDPGLHDDLRSYKFSEADIGQEKDTAEHETPQDFETQDLLYVAEERLTLLLNQEGLEEWGGWPQDYEILEYSENDRSLKYDAGT